MQSFSAVAKQNSPKPEFPSLNSQQEFPSLNKTRQEILLNNLLGKTEKADKHTLMGLIDIIQMKNEDLSVLSLGTDLSLLNLNLNSSDPIYSQFMTPFTDNPTLGHEPSFKLPSSYTLHHLKPTLTRLSQCSDETLFYIFYSMPRDVLQEASAQELYQRQWRYHKDFKLWLCKDPQQETVKTPTSERGIFIFFDPSTWQTVKKEWVVHYHQLEERQGENTERLPDKRSR
ncbi:hypothetical protein EDD86DRAFT_206330 [Gorgonomyces haynaldii]|nr:hypothetical protein EDD86DRAFT_206330 [Gorgonomyces haynaldii]